MNIALVAAIVLVSVVVVCAGAFVIVVALLVRSGRKLQRMRQELVRDIEAHQRTYLREYDLDL